MWPDLRPSDIDFYAPLSRVRDAQRSHVRAFLLRDAKGAIHRQPDHDIRDAYSQQPRQEQRSSRLMVWVSRPQVGQWCDRYWVISGTTIYQLLLAVVSR
jgi:hypothetical protein